MRPIGFITFVVLGLSAAPVIALENLPPAVVSHLNQQGPLVSSSFFRSVNPAPQIVLYYCIDEALKGGKHEGANNPSFSHCAVALFNRGRHGKWFFGDVVDIGQGRISEFSNGLVSGESIDYGNDDALCCPSKRAPIRFNASGGKLVRIAE
jgi:hypothetical protein